MLVHVCSALMQETLYKAPPKQARNAVIVDAWIFFVVGYFELSLVRC